MLKQVSISSTSSVAGSKYASCQAASKPRNSMFNHGASPRGIALMWTPKLKVKALIAA